MSIEDRSSDDLEKSRTRIVEEIADLNDKISTAKLDSHKSERHDLERKRGYKKTELDAVDTEFRRRGLTRHNA